MVIYACVWSDLIRRYWPTVHRQQKESAMRHFRELILDVIIGRFAQLMFVAYLVVPQLAWFATHSYFHLQRLWEVFSKLGGADGSFVGRMSSEIAFGSSIPYLLFWHFIYLIAAGGIHYGMFRLQIEFLFGDLDRQLHLSSTVPLTQLLLPWASFGPIQDQEHSGIAEVISSV